MVSLVRWNRDWRKIATLARDPDEYTPITADLAGKRFEVLKFSPFSPKFDEDSPYLMTPMREFDDSTAYFSHRTRDTGIGRFIVKRRERVWVLEPGDDLLGYSAAREGVEVAELVRLARQSEVGRKLASAVRQAERKKRANEEAIRDDLQIFVEDELHFALLERNHAQRELMRLGAD